MLKKNVKKSIVIILTILLILALIYKVLYPTYYKYCDMWIIGRSVDEVRERYGDFDYQNKRCVAYYIYTDDTGLMPDYIDYYYFMNFDESGIIYEVYSAPERGG